MKLYGYWRSTAAQRVRIALNLKGIAYELVPVHLVKSGGEQHAEAFRRKNPAGLVPALELDDGRVIVQSLAIVGYLEEVQPDPPLLPDDAFHRAKVTAAAHTIAMDIHPVNNLRVGLYYKETTGRSQEDWVVWMNHWMHLGLTAFQAEVFHVGDFCYGDRPSLADVCLVPQLYNARRWGLDLAPFERLTEIEANCLKLPAFENARPENQPDRDA